MEAVDRRSRPRRPRGTLKADDPTRVATASVTRDHKRPKGASGTIINLGLITKFELTTEIRGKAWYEAALEMMQDPHVKRSVEAIVDPLLAAYWDISPGEKSPEAIEAADLCKWNFFERLPWERTLRLGVTGMVRDGVRVPCDGDGQACIPRTMAWLDRSSPSSPTNTSAPPQVVDLRTCGAHRVHHVGELGWAGLSFSRPV